MYDFITSLDLSYGVVAHLIVGGFIGSWLRRKFDVRTAKKKAMLAEYEQLMIKSGYTRSYIGKVAIWIPPPRPMPTPRKETEND